MLTRRNFCKYLAAASAGAATLDLGGLTGDLLAAETFTVTELGPGRWVLSGGGGNVLLLANGGAPVMVDAGVGAVAPELLDLVTDRVGQASCTLFNTHHHGDHIGGNYMVHRSFEAEVTVYGQEKLTARVADTLDQSIRPGLLRMAESATDPAAATAAAKAMTAAEFAPTVTFADDLEVSLGDTAFRLHHRGPGHTDNDAVVFLPHENILHMGDLVFNNLHPYVIPQHGADVAGWQTVLDQVYKLCDADTVVIPGHGDISDRTALVRMNDYFSQVTEIVAAALKDGRTREEVAELKPEVHATRGLANVQHMTLTKIYDELTAGG